MIAQIEQMALASGWSPSSQAKSLEEEFLCSAATSGLATSVGLFHRVHRKVSEADPPILGQ